MARKAKQAEEKTVETTESPAVTVGDEVIAPVVEEAHPRRKGTCPGCNVGVAVSMTVKSNGAYVYDCPECGHRWVA